MLISIQILENDTFLSSYLESEPYVRELVENWVGGKFKAVLESLERNSVRPLRSYTSPDALLTAHGHRVDTPRALATPGITPARADAAHPLARGRAVLPAVRDSASGQDGERVWVDGRRDGAGGRPPHRRGRDQGSCGSSWKGAFITTRTWSNSIG